MSHRSKCERFLNALKQGDFDEQNKMLSDDFVCNEAAGLPYGGTFHGTNGWRNLAISVGRTWKGFKLEFLEFVAETGNNAVLRFAISGNSRKTGKYFESTVLELWRFHEERIIEIIPYYWDTNLLVQTDEEPG